MMGQTQSSTNAYGIYNLNEQNSSQTAEFCGNTCPCFLPCLFCFQTLPGMIRAGCFHERYGPIPMIQSVLGYIEPYIPESMRQCARSSFHCPIHSTQTPPNNCTPYSTISNHAYGCNFDPEAQPLLYTTAQTQYQQNNLPSYFNNNVYNSDIHHGSYHSLYSHSTLYTNTYQHPHHVSSPLLQFYKNLSNSNGTEFPGTTITTSTGPPTSSFHSTDIFALLSPPQTQVIPTTSHDIILSKPAKTKTKGEKSTNDLTYHQILRQLQIQQSQVSHTTTSNSSANAENADINATLYTHDHNNHITASLTNPLEVQLPDPDRTDIPIIGPPTLFTAPLTDERPILKKFKSKKDHKKALRKTAFNRFDRTPSPSSSPTHHPLIAQDSHQSIDNHTQSGFGEADFYSTTSDLASTNTPSNVEGFECENPQNLLIDPTEPIISSNITEPMLSGSLARDNELGSYHHHAQPISYILANHTDGDPTSHSESKYNQQHRTISSAQPVDIITIDPPDFFVQDDESCMSSKNAAIGTHVTINPPGYNPHYAGAQSISPSTGDITFNRNLCANFTSKGQSISQWPPPTRMVHFRRPSAPDPALPPDLIESDQTPLPPPASRFPSTSSRSTTFAPGHRRHNSEIVIPHSFINQTQDTTRIVSRPLSTVLPSIHHNNSFLYGYRRDILHIDDITQLYKINHKVIFSPQNTPNSVVLATCLITQRKIVMKIISLKQSLFDLFSSLPIYRNVVESAIQIRHNLTRPGHTPTEEEQILLQQHIAVLLNQMPLLSYENKYLLNNFLFLLNLPFIPHSTPLLEVLYDGSAIYTIYPVVFGPTLYEYLTVYTQKSTFMQKKRKFYQFSHTLLKTLKQFQNHGFLHNDLKSDNIIWGISHYSNNSNTQNSIDQYNIGLSLQNNNLLYPQTLSNHSLNINSVEKQNDEEFNNITRGLVVIDFDRIISAQCYRISEYFTKLHNNVLQSGVSKKNAQNASYYVNFLHNHVGKPYVLTLSTLLYTIIRTDSFQQYLIVRHQIEEKMDNLELISSFTHFLDNSYVNTLNPQHFANKLQQPNLFTNSSLENTANINTILNNVIPLIFIAPEQISIFNDLFELIHPKSTPINNQTNDVNQLEHDIDTIVNFNRTFTKPNLTQSDLYKLGNVLLTCLTSKILFSNKQYITVLILAFILKQISSSNQHVLTRTQQVISLQQSAPHFSDTVDVETDIIRFYDVIYAFIIDLVETQQTITSRQNIPSPSPPGRPNVYTSIHYANIAQSSQHSPRARQTTLRPRSSSPPSLQRHLDGKSDIKSAQQYLFSHNCQPKNIFSPPTSPPENNLPQSSPAMVATIPVYPTHTLSSYDCGTHQQNLDFAPQMTPPSNPLTKEQKLTLSRMRFPSISVLYYQYRVRVRDILIEMFNSLIYNATLSIENNHNSDEKSVKVSYSYEINMCNCGDVRCNSYIPIFQLKKIEGNTKQIDPLTHFSCNNITVIDSITKVNYFKHSSSLSTLNGLPVQGIGMGVYNNNSNFLNDWNPHLQLCRFGLQQQQHQRISKKYEFLTTLLQFHPQQRFMMENAISFCSNNQQ